MKKAILISIMLHIVVLYTYPAINIKWREPPAQDTSISYLGIMSDEDFLKDKKSERTVRAISTSPRFSGLESQDKVWDAPEVSVDVEWELFSEPGIDEKELNSLLKNEARKYLLDEIMETYEKEAPPLIEERETKDGE